MVCKLSQGSKWKFDGNTVSVIDSDDREHTVNISRNSVLVDVDRDCSEAYINDLLAIIDNAGLDPVRTAARELVSLDTASLVFRETLKKLKALL